MAVYYDGYYNTRERKPRISPTGAPDVAHDDCVICGAEAFIQTWDGEPRGMSMTHKIKGCRGRQGVRDMIARGRAEHREMRIRSILYG